MKVSAQNGRIVTEVPQKMHPGWIKIEERDPAGVLKNYRYRTPAGKVITKDQARRAWQREAAERTSASTGEHAPAGQPRNTRGMAAGGHGSPALPPVLEVPAATIPAPEPLDIKPDTGRSGGQATGEQSAITFAMALIVLTSLAALLTNSEEIAMTQQEAQGIAGPLGNIFAKSSLNKRYGRYVAEGGDYTALGYGLYAYAYRVGTQMRARAQYAQQQGQVAAAAPPMPSRGVPIHAVPQAAQPGPVAPAGAGSANPEQRSQPATGGLAGAAGGYVPAEASRFVGHNPITAHGRPA